MAKNKRAVSLAKVSDSSFSNQRRNHTTPKRRGKTFRILSILASGESLNRFQALHHGDSTMNTTVSCIQLRYGIQVARKTEKFEGKYGTVRCCRYWIQPGPDMDRARALCGITEAA